MSTKAECKSLGRKWSSSRSVCKPMSKRRCTNILNGKWNKTKRQCITKKEYMQPSTPADVIVLSDSESDDEPVRAPKSRRKNRAVVLSDSESDSSESDDEDDKPLRAKTAIPRDSEESDDDTPLSLPKPKAKKSDDDDDDDKPLSVPKPKAIEIVEIDDTKTKTTPVETKTIVPNQAAVLQSTAHNPPDTSPAAAMHMLRLNLENACHVLAHSKIAVSEQNRCRKLVHDAVLRRLGGLEPTPYDFSRVITGETLQHMLHQYDALFFSGRLLRLCAEHGCQFVICWNNKCTKTAGYMKTVCRQHGCHTIHIELAVKVFQKAMQSADLSNGVMHGCLACHNTLECLQLTFEHELVHALIRCLCDAEGSRHCASGAQGSGTWTGAVSPSSGHSRIFMSILNNVFGHDVYKHSLFTNPRQKAANDQLAQDNKTDLKSMQLGSVVEFVAKGVAYRGVLKKRNPSRAKVLVEEPAHHAGKTFTVPYVLFVHSS